ncbi:MAG: UDP-N-acetylglucosamine 1-carboxyvinyltransferase 1 [Clostridia bacterium 41_269]|nr:MAG: UDP-N-acetylglucosamine 1-carboxyvinyltransferase 1 [Clostridia bacterium 41_269]
MEKIMIEGGTPLEGSVRISGAKNSVLPVMAASILASGETVLREIPDLADVRTMCELLKNLGGICRREGDVLHIDFSDVASSEAPYEFMRRMRASILVMGPLLARTGYAKMSMPGGCAIGARPIDLHLKGLAAMGADIKKDHGWITVRAKKLAGARIYLDFPSVGATENIMMAASLAEGITIIENAAEEPEIVDLANFLNSMGSRITGAGTNIIRIEGVKELKPVQHTVIPDRIEAGTFMVAAAACGGDILVENAIIDHLKPVMAKLREAGAVIEEKNSGLRVVSNPPLKAVDVKTLPYPGFPTDMQAQMMALLTTARGTSVVTETVFENRFMHVNELKRMGADIIIEGHSAVVKGVPFLTGAQVKATDLRAGAALVIAGMMAKNTTEVTGVEHIDRGYEDLVGKLRGLGAKIWREKFEEDEGKIQDTAEAKL